jgi:hypothetical protein
MGTELPENDQQDSEQKSTLIFGSEQNQPSPQQGDLKSDDLASPVETGNSSKPELQTAADQPLELTRLKHELEVTIAKFRQEHEQRILAEAQLAAVERQTAGDTTAADVIQMRMRLETRQMELIQRMESLLEKADKLGLQGGRLAAVNGLPFQIRKLLPSLAAGILGGGVVALLPWLSGQRQTAQFPRQSPGPQTQAQLAASPVRAQESVQFSCAEPCWLDIREAEGGKTVFYKLLKGTANFALGSGLDVFSGRADLVKVRINNGPEQLLLTDRIVGSRVIRPSMAAQPSP